MAIKPIPEGFHTVTAYMGIKGASDAIDFYKRAFNATESFRLNAPDGTVGHAEIRIGDSVIMLADACDQGPFKDPDHLGGTSIGLHLYVKDVDALFEQAVKAGAKVVRPVEDQFYGDRTGGLEDPFGHIWFLATHKEDLTPEEVNQRAAALYQQSDS